MTYTIPSPLYYGAPALLGSAATISVFKTAQNFSKAFLGSDEIKSRFEKLSQSDSYRPVRETLHLIVGTNSLSERVSELGQGLTNLAITYSFLYIMLGTPYSTDQLKSQQMVGF